MNDRVFIDTNVLVYLFDSRDQKKQRVAGELMQRLVEEKIAPVVSTQVLQEAYSALTRKLGMDPAEAMAALQAMEGASFVIQQVDVPLIWRGATRSIEDKLTFWDGLIVETAREAACSVLYTEDLQAGRVFDGLTIRNPFAT